jgi:uncharacterized protein
VDAAPTDQPTDPGVGASPAAEAGPVAPVSAVAPVAPAERVVTLDVIRGFALLGILLINLQSMALSRDGVFNPPHGVPPDSPPALLWAAVHVLAVQKFMTLFSLLFGAGILLIGDRADARRPGSAWPLHLRRMAVLALIGVAHGTLIWFGDVLLTYALCGTIAFAFRRLRPRTLVLLGAAGIAVASAFALVPLPGEAGDGGVAGWWVGRTRVWFDPPPRQAVYLRGYADEMARRPHEFFEHFASQWPVWSAWHTTGVMLVGMALMKWRLLTGGLSRGTTWAITLTCGAAGLALCATSAWLVLRGHPHGFEPLQLGSLPQAIGYAGAIVLLCRSPRAVRSLRPVAAVGRTALSNYLLQSLLGTFLFYGHGLGLGGQLHRPGVLGVAACIWAVQLAVSPLWLRWFRSGPVEWLWRTAAYMRLQPIRRRDRP